MKLSTRLTRQFLLQLLLLFLLLAVMYFGFHLYVIQPELRERDHAVYPALLLEEIGERATRENGRPTVPDDLAAGIVRNGGWLQALDASGREVYALGRPDDVPTAYAPGQLIAYREYPTASGHRLHTWYSAEDPERLTWVLGFPLASGGQKTEESFLPPYLALLLLTILLALLVALLFGRHLGGPLLHMMSWLQMLARGEYAEPTTARGLPKSRLGSGQLRRSYRLYEEVIAALNRLTGVLREAREEREVLDSSREEWIVGVSHDLKTPLSSVKGYAELLHAERYRWSEEEVRQFAAVILDKTAHMEELIEELNLTYRLSNHALPLQRALRDPVEAVREAVIRLANDPRAAQMELCFEEPEAGRPLSLYPLDPHWFGRALDNLLINAVLHNPPGTNIAVRIEGDADSPGGLRLTIRDDGRGMDEETKSRLFDRYYRGTSTDRAGEGSGLGTAIAKQLIDAHDGTILVESTVGQGTTFTLLLPPAN